jgi:WD40 repeat protein/tetratricopeptide (TPR) repeat protein
MARKGDTDDTLRSIAVRRRKFQSRIEKIKQLVKDTKVSIEERQRERLVLIETLDVTADKLQARETEQERVIQSGNTYHDTSIIHGELQRFKTHDLLELLKIEIEIEKTYIGEVRQELLELETRIKQYLDQFKNLKYQQRERERALREFEKESTTIQQQQTSDAALKAAARFLLIAWQAYTAQQKTRRIVLTRTMQIIKVYQLRTAFPIWVSYRHYESTSIISRGGRLLDRRMHQRLVLEQEYHALIQQVSTTKDDQMPGALCAAHRSRNIDEIKSQRYQLWRQGEACRALGDWAGSKTAYEKHFEYISMHSQDTTLLEQGRCFYSMGLLAMDMNEGDSALIEFRKAHLIAEQTGDLTGMAQALYGVGHVMRWLYNQHESNESLNKAKTLFESIHGEQSMAAACVHSMTLPQFGTRASNEVHPDETWCQEVKKMKGTLKKCEEALLKESSCSSVVYRFERVGAIVPKLRNHRIKLKRERIQIQQKNFFLRNLLKERTSKVETGRIQLEQAISSQAFFVTSDIIIGTKSRYTTGTFEKELKSMTSILTKARPRIEMEHDKFDISIHNVNDKIQEIEEDLQTETGALMQNVHAKRSLRAGCMNASNVALSNIFGNEATGTNLCAMTSQDSIWLYELRTGVCVASIMGEIDNPSRQFEARRGHRKMISCLYMRNDRLYSGGMDAALGIFSIVTKEEPKLLAFVTKPFHAAVMSLDASDQFIVAGSADLSLTLLDAETFDVLCVLKDTHYRTVVSLQICEKQFASGGADGCIKIWTVERSVKTTCTLASVLSASKGTSQFDDGHLGSVTSISFLGHELVSGDRRGAVILWDLKKQKPIRCCKIHEGPVTSLQLDDGVVISGGTDGTVNMTDIRSGNIFTRGRGHKGPVLAVQFDKKNLLSLGRDGSVRDWLLKGDTHVDEAGTEGMHVVKTNETLQSISESLAIGITLLMEHNNLTQQSEISVGQTLTVPTVRKQKSHVSSTLGNLKEEAAVDMEELQIINGCRDSANSENEKIMVASITNEFFPSTEAT